MRKILAVGAIFSLFALAVVFAFVISGPGEPDEISAIRERTPEAQAEKLDELRRLVLTTRSSKHFRELVEHGEASVPALVEFATDRGRSVRERFFDLFGTFTGVNMPYLAEGGLAGKGDIENLPLMALNALGELGETAAPAIPVLLEFAGNDERPGSIRAAAVEVLGQIGPRAGSSEDLLLDLMKASDGGVDATRAIRRNAAWALGRIGADPDRAIPVLVGALEKDQPEVSAAAAAALGEFGPAADRALHPLVYSLAAGDPLVTAGALRSLILSEGKGTVALTELVRFGEVPAFVVSEYFHSSAELSSRFGAKTGSGEIAVTPGRFRLVTTAYQILSDSPSNHYSRQGREILRGALARRGEGIEELLSGMLASPDTGLKVLAARSLAASKGAGRAVRLLGRMAGDSSAPYDDRSAAIEGLSACGDHAVEGLDGLRAAIPDTFLFEQTAEAVAAIGRAARPLLPELIGALQLRRESWHRQKVVRAVVSMGDEAVHDLVRILSSGDQAMRLAAGSVLGDLGETIPLVLAESIAEMDAPAMVVAAGVIGSYGERAAEVAPSLEKLLTPERTVEVRAALIMALGRIGPAAAPAAPKIAAEILNPEWDDLAGPVMMAASGIGDPIFAQFEMIFARSGPEAKIQIALLAERLGPEANAARNMLVQGLEDEDESVRKACRAALDRIETSESGL